MKRARTAKPKRKDSSRQTTINHFIGGKPVPYQPPVTKFFKRQVAEDTESTAELPSNTPLPCPHVKIEEVKTDLPHEMAGAHNPLKKLSSLKKLNGTTPDNNVESNSATARKPLSLKVRKRKFRTIESPENPNCTNVSSAPKIIKSDAPALDESDLLSLYSGDVQKAIKFSDLEHYHNKTQKASNTSVVITETNPSVVEKTPTMLIAHSKPISSSLAISEIHTSTNSTAPSPHKTILETPTKATESLSYPSFSPCKLKCLSPLLKAKPTDSQSLNSSIPLFSTPENSKLTQSSNRLSTPSSKRRVVFTEPQAAMCSTSAETKAAIKEEYSFDDDMDFLDQSDLLAGWDSSISKQPTGFCRYLVLEKISQMSINSTERPKPEIMLRLFEEKTKAEEVCFLRDDWLTTDVEPGDIVQLNADYAGDCFTIDNTAQFSSIVVNPDTLISGTSVANSITCVRRVVLSERFKGQQSSGSEAMVMGQLLHEVFQRVLLKRNRAGSSLTGAELGSVVREEIRNVVTSIGNLNQLFCLDMSEEAACELLSENIPAIVEWCDRYMHSKSDNGRMSTGSGSNNYVAVTDVLDIEENIWSPRYGLKGKVDVSMLAEEGRQGDRTAEAVRVPLELKTGKMFRKQGTIEHRAQVALYSLMLGDRYSAQPPGGLLYYLKGGHMQSLPSLPHEIRGLINARNHLSRYYTSSGDCMNMPGLLKDKFTCKYCPCLKECMLYHSAIEEGDEGSSGVGELFTEQVSSLSKSHRQFFVKWYSLVAQEEAQSKTQDSAPLWLAESTEREKEGRCHANLTAKPPDCPSLLERQKQVFAQPPSSAPIRDSLLSATDSVVISRQNGTGWALAMGVITKPMREGEIEVLVDKAVEADSGVLYRIDATPGYGGNGMAGGLADFCTSDSERDHRLRRLIIDLEPPRYTAEQPIQVTFSDEAKGLMSTLNESQKSVVTKVLKSQDYTLILGMPGTGKTTTISTLVRLLVALGKSVLLTSYTHLAVDNILLKLKKDSVNFLRLGSLYRVHPSVQAFTPSQLCSNASTVQELEQLYMSTPVVATTCLGIKHPLFARRSFDVCIIDEASQITLPMSIGPLRYSDTFVLVGDHYQLPPLVKSQQAREGGLDVSLFRHLSEHHPSSLVTLELQYRMNREIMSLSNKLIYHDCLKCGSEEVARGRLSLPHLTTHPSPSQGCSMCEKLMDHSWLKEVVDPNRPVLFINTDKSTKGTESMAGDHICNKFEAELVATVVDTFIQFGLLPDRIGVITPMRYQQNLIRERVQSTVAGVTEPNTVEVNTIDKYQGRDKECIILSFVRSNLKGSTGPLLKDWRRINVALTRAKHKLVLIGSFNTLRRIPLLEYMLKHLIHCQSLIHLLPEHV